MNHVDYACICSSRITTALGNSGVSQEHGLIGAKENYVGFLISPV